jgi:hypothetical protein
MVVKDLSVEVRNSLRVVDSRCSELQLLKLVTFSNDIALVVQGSVLANRDLPTFDVGLFFPLQRLLR